MFDDRALLLLATPVDEVIEVAIFERIIKMPVWVLILLAILFGWLVLPKVVAYVKA